MTVIQDGALVAPVVASWADAPWMPYALAELGQRELPGNADNPRVVLYHSYAGGRAPDEVAWCSSFVNFCMAQAGVPRTEKKNARSWMRWGKETTAPFPGCVVIFSRPPKPASGHVGFWVGAEGKNILVLGGNQNNSVCVKPYPAARLLAYRAMV